MTAGPRRWRVHCTGLLVPPFDRECRWTSYRTADSAATAAHGKCPRCGSPLIAGKPA